MTVHGFDVSRWQNPDKLDWVGMEDDPDFKFVIARASYGAKTADKHFAEFVTRTREIGAVVGVYLFLRQIHSVEEQLAVFDRQLEMIGGLRPGDLYPVLDLETNEVNGDGKIRARHFAEMAQTITEAWIEQYGGCIVYCSSYFPSWLGASRPAGRDYSGWLKDPQIYMWLADYDREPGKPRTPYTHSWYIHQPKPRKHPYYNEGKTVIDVDVLNPSIGIEPLLIEPVEDYIPEEAHQCECGTDERPGGADNPCP